MTLGGAGGLARQHLAVFVEERDDVALVDQPLVKAARQPAHDHARPLHPP